MRTWCMIRGPIGMIKVIRCDVPVLYAIENMKEKIDFLVCGFLGMPGLVQDFLESLLIDCFPALKS